MQEEITGPNPFLLCFSLPIASYSVENIFGIISLFSVAKGQIYNSTGYHVAKFY